MSVTFDVVFGVFVAAMLVIAVLAVRWAVGRDRAERARRGATEEAGDTAERRGAGAPQAAGASPNGRPDRAGPHHQPGPEAPGGLP